MIRNILIVLFFFLQNTMLFSQNHYWKNLDGLYGGLLYSVDVKDNNVYCSGNGGVFGSSDFGENWENLGFRDKTVAQIRLSSNYIFAVTDNGCFRCRLHDTTWVNVKEGRWDLLEAKDSIIFISTRYAAGLYRTTDLGNTWTRVDKNFDNLIAQIFITSNNTVLASVVEGYNPGIFRSTDWGESWQKSDTSSNAWYFNGITEYNNNLYSFVFQNYAKVHKSTDWGRTWYLPSNASVPADIIQTIHADKTGLYVGVDIYGFFRSTDEGVHWNKLHNGLTNKNIFSLRGYNSYLFAATFDGIYKFSEVYLNWTKQSRGMNNSWITSLSEVSNKLLIGTYGSGIFTGDSTGFMNINLGDDFWFIVDMIVSDNIIYVIANSTYPGGYTRLYISFNSGNTWTKVIPPGNVSGIQNIAKDDRYIYGGGSYGLYRVDLNNYTWEKLTNGIPGNVYVTDLAVSDSVIIVVNGTSYIYRSTDYGNSWNISDVSGLWSGSVITSSQNGVFFIGSSGISNLFKSIDYGLTWEILNNPLSGSDVQAIYLKDSSLYVGLSSSGILVSSDMGENWVRDNTGLASKNVTSFTNIGSDIYAGTKLNGIYKKEAGIIIPPSDSTEFEIKILSDSIFYSSENLKFIWSSSKIANSYRFQLAGDSIFSKLIIDEEDIFDTTYILSSLDYNKYYYCRASGVTILWDNHFSTIQKIRIANPSNFLIYNNYPNPFNNSTIIKYGVPYKNMVELELFDILGRKLKTLLKQEHEPGEYKFALEMGNLSSGIYIVRLKAAGFSKSIKIVLLK